MGIDERREMVEPDNSLGVVDQCALLQLNRSTYYYEPILVSERDKYLMDRIDEIYTRRPFFGYRRVCDALCDQEGNRINHKKVRRMMNLLGLQAIHPRKNLSRADTSHEIFPYLLRDMMVREPNQVWCSDITYIRMKKGFLYLTAEMDWYSRYVLSWDLSNTLDSATCVSVLSRALAGACPEISNTDQGSQFTSKQYLDVLKNHEIKISMDGRGRAFDNIFIERLWRTVKYEEVYLNEYRDGHEAYDSLTEYFLFYNNERKHSSLEGRTPKEVYFNC